MLLYRVYLLLFCSLAILSCGNKNQLVKNNSTDTTSTQNIEKPDETKMTHFTGVYHRRIENNVMKDTMGFVHIWYDEKFIIIQDTLTETNPKFTLKIGQPITEPNLDLYKRLGGVDPETAYQLETNEQGYTQLIVFTSKNLIPIGDFKYGSSFTLVNSTGAKTYFCSEVSGAAVDKLFISR